MAAQNHSTQGNDKGTLSDEQGRKPATTTREQARRINSLTFGVVTAGWRFESSAAHHFSVSALWNKSLNFSAHSLVTRTWEHLGTTVTAVVAGLCVGRENPSAHSVSNDLR